MLPVILNNIDLNQFKASIESSVTELTGRQLKIDGDLQLKLSLHPFIRIEKVSFANASWSKHPQMLAFDVLQLQVELLPLLKKQLVVEQLRLHGVVLFVEKNIDGQLNWLLEKFVSDEAEADDTTTEASAFELPLIPVFKQVEFDAVNIHYSDVEAEIETSINLVMLRLSNQTINEPFDFQANGMINKHPFDFTGETKFLAAPVESSSEMKKIEQGAGINALSVKFNANALGATLSASGEIKLSEADNDIDIEASLIVPDLDKTFIEATGKSLKQLSINTSKPVPLKFSARLTSRSDNYNLHELKLQLADSDLDGEISFINNPERPEIQAKLHSEKVNISQLLAKASRQPSKQASNKKAKLADKKVSFELPDTPLPFELLESLDANIQYSAGQILAAALDVKAIKLSAVLQSSKLQIKQFDFNIGKATVRSHMSVDSQSKTPAVSADIDIKKLELAPIAKILTLTQLQQGRLNTTIKFKARGDNLRSLLRSLRGKSHVQLEQVKAGQQIDNKQYDLYVETLELNFTEMNAPLKVAIEGSVNKEKLSLSGELATLTSLLNNSATNLNLKFIALGSVLSLHGRIEKPLTADAAHINITLTAPKPEKTITRLSRLLPGKKLDINVPAQPVRLMTQLDISADNFSAKNIELTVGVSDLTGEVSVNTKEKKPVITANLSSKLLDIDSLLPPRDKQNSANKQKPRQEKADTGGRLFSTEPLPHLDALNRFNATLHYKLKKLTVNNEKIHNISLDLVLDEGELQIDPLTVDLAEGTYRARLKLSQDVKLRLQLELDVKVNKLSYDRLMAMIGTEEYAKGYLNAEVHLQGTGGSVSDLMAGLNGKIRITTEHGHMNKQAMQLLSKDLSSLIPFTTKSDKQEIRCAVIDFNVNNGVAETHALLIDTGIVSALGTGKIDLATETLSLYIDPRTKRTSLMKLALIPLNVTGSLTSPSITPDVVGSTLSTTRTAATISIAFATGGLSLIAEGATNKLWEKYIDDTDYCALGLAGEKVVPVLKKLENDQIDQDEYYPVDQNGQDYDYIEELDDDYGGF